MLIRVNSKRTEKRDMKTKDHICKFVSSVLDVQEIRKNSYRYLIIH